MYYVYIITNRTNRVLYTGVTNNIERRMYEHKNKKIPGFTEKYNLNKLVYYQSFSTINDAIAAEKKIKGWRRSRKIVLIREMNPDWDDLSEV